MPKGSPGQKKSESHKQKLREAATRRYASDEERQQQSTRMKVAFQQHPSLQRMHDPESRQKQAETLKVLWTDEAYRQHMQSRRTDPDIIQQLRTEMLTNWSDESYRQKMCESMQTARRSGYSHPERLENVDWLRQENTTKTLTQMAEEMGCSQSFLSGIFHQHGLIPRDHATTYQGGEQQVVEYLQSVGVTHIERHNRQVIAPYEIDIYLPDVRIGIKYHGVYWHSYARTETARERQRHTQKHDLAQAAGIRLFQFWDTEWQQSPLVCQSILANALGITPSLGARACTLGTPTLDEVRRFLDTHHLQGYCPYHHAAGLYHKGTLVMVLTLGRSRFAAGRWELLRLAATTGMTIAGGAQRLWKHLRPHIPPQTVVVSYADCRLFTGRVYTQLGFTLSHKTPAGYAYVLDGHIHSRLRFQKHKLAKLFPTFDVTLTEADNMFAHGYRRLWDAGQSVWTQQC